MRFPVTIRHRKAEAKIYGKSKNYPFYRVAAYVGGKRRMASYGTYSEARTDADSLVRDIAAGSQAAALTAGQANDALAALQRLDGLCRDTGRRVSLLAVAIEYAEAARKLNGRTLGQAVDGYLSTVVSVKRMDLGQAVEKFIQGRAHRTETKDGKRPQLSGGYHGREKGAGELVRRRAAGPQRPAQHHHDDALHNQVGPDYPSNN